ncbi:MAG: SCP2 sterol-binding domain-containing protein [Paracoccaceae bacterium]
MSEVIAVALAALKEKMPDGFDGLAKVVIEGEGTIMIDANGAREGDEAADVTLTASAEVFQGILTGDTNATMAFMTGKLSVDGSMGLAMKLGSALS